MSAVTRSIQTEVLVIGGGATGVGTAWDAALRGFDVVLVERGDLVEGTSGRFHGLLHSGGRYVVKDPVAAKECVDENALLRRLMPDCIEDTGGLFVTTPEDDPDYADRFLAGCHATSLPVEELEVAEALRREPRLNPGILRAFAVADASIDAWKTASSLARGATAHGARVLTYHRVVDLHRDGGAVTGARVRDERSGEEFDIEAAFILNASGPWAAQILHMAGIEDVGVIPGKGIMIAMNHRLVNTVINRCVVPADGDILVPIRTVSVIGTTDIRAADPDELPVTQEEVDQMLDDGERLVPGFRKARALRVWAGARPLFQDARAGEVTDTRDVSRTHAVVDHQARDGVKGLLTMSGGKLTTFRLMAQDLVDAMCEQLGEQRPCRDRGGQAARQRGRRVLRHRLAAAPARAHAGRRGADLRVRADRPPAARGGARAGAARRTSTTSGASSGSAWARARAASASTGRRGSCTRSSNSTANRRPRRCITSSRSAGRACGRSSTATSCARRGSTTGSSRVCSTSSTCRRSGEVRRR